MADDTDYPVISQNPNDPLPQVDPNSALVPYRTSSTVPGQAPVVTAGYAARARPPIQPPDGFGGGVGFPSLDRIYQAAFSQLPVDEAVKATEAATRYIGLRGYQRDLSSGKTAEQALATWGPMILKSGVGIPEVLQAQMQRQKLAQPSLREAGGGLYRVPVTGPAETLVAPRPPAPKLHFDNSTGEIVQENPEGFKVLRPGTPKPKAPKQASITVPLDPANPEGAKITGPPDDPDVQEAVGKHEQYFKPKLPPPAEKTILEKAKDLIVGKPPVKVETQEQYDALKSGDVYIGKNGKKHRKP